VSIPGQLASILALLPCLVQLLAIPTTWQKTLKASETFYLFLGIVRMTRRTHPCHSPTLQGGGESVKETVFQRVGRGGHSINTNTLSHTLNQVGTPTRPFDPHILIDL
jgi:hypothetical protein